MQQYEIRILRADHSTATIIEILYPSDDAAIRSAQKLAQARPFEVWRGLDCLHAANRQPHPHRPAA